MALEEHPNPCDVVSFDPNKIWMIAIRGDLQRVEKRLHALETALNNHAYTRIELLTRENSKLKIRLGRIKKRDREVREEMKKFTEGFSYVKPRSAASRAKPKVHGVEHKRNRREARKDS